MGEEEKKDQNEGGEEKTLEEEIADIDFGDTDELMDSDESSETEGGTEDEKGASDDTSSDDDKDEKEDKKEEGTKEDSKTSEEEKETETEEEKKTEGEKEGDPKDHQITKLMQEIERLSGLTKSEPADEKKSDDEEEEKKSDEASIHDFIGDIDMDDVSADPAVFNKILHQVITKVQQQTAEQVLKSIPQVVLSQVQQQSYFKKMADQFYTDNADLVNVKQVVKACAQQIQQTNPEWDVEKVFKETAMKTRQTLGMTAVKINSDGNIPSAEDAAFARQKGGSKSNLKPQKSSLQMEIDEL